LGAAVAILTVPFLLGAQAPAREHYSYEKTSVLVLPFQGSPKTEDVRDAVRRLVCAAIHDSTLFRAVVPTEREIEEYKYVITGLKAENARQEDGDWKTDGTDVFFQTVKSKRRKVLSRPRADLILRGELARFGERFVVSMRLARPLARAPIASARADADKESRLPDAVTASLRLLLDRCLPQAIDKATGEVLRGCGAALLSREHTMRLLEALARRNPRAVAPRAALLGLVIKGKTGADAVIQRSQALIEAMKSPGPEDVGTLARSGLDPFLELARAQRAKEDLKGAVAAHRAALKAEWPDRRTHLNALGKGLVQLGDFKAARKALHESVKLNDADLTARRTLADLAVRQKDFRLAVSHLRAIARYTDDPKERRSARASAERLSRLAP